MLEGLKYETQNEPIGRSDFGISRFRICFEFRISVFGFLRATP